MTHSVVIEGLIRTRSEIAGRLQKAQTEVDRLVADLGAVDRTLELSGYTETAANIPRKTRGSKIEIEDLMARRAFVTRCLGEAGKPIRASEIARRYREAHGVLATDSRTLAFYRVKIINVLRGLRTQGIAIQVGKGLGSLWHLPT